MSDSFVSFSRSLEILPVYLKDTTIAVFGYSFEVPYPAYDEESYEQLVKSIDPKFEILMQLGEKEFEF